MRFSRFNTNRVFNLLMAPSLECAYRSGTVHRSVLIRSDLASVWEQISKIMELESWVSGVTKTHALSKSTRGIGARRSIEFDDNAIVREQIVGWSSGHYFSYIMIDGLPLRTYHATIGAKMHSRTLTRVLWQSYFGSKKSTRADFGMAVSTISTLYASSLDRLKRLIESSQKHE